MSDPIPSALRLLAGFWLEEVRPHDLPTIAALPGLAETLPDAHALDEVAVEFQRLFGFNAPPYESAFVDPSAMMGAPSTLRVQALYRQGGWAVPQGARVGAPDHLGLELLALAAWQEQGLSGAASALHTRHLALWVPPFVWALQRLHPHPFYAALAALTVDLLLATLPDTPLEADPFPSLLPLPAAQAAPDEGPRARDVVRHLLTPSDSGLWLAREALARLFQALELPPVMGERSHMLDTLLRAAGQYDLLPLLFDNLRAIFADAHRTYEGWAAAYPRWTPYAQAWQARLEHTCLTFLTDLPATPFEVPPRDAS